MLIILCYCCAIVHAYKSEPPRGTLPTSVLLPLVPNQPAQPAEGPVAFRAISALCSEQGRGGRGLVGLHPRGLCGPSVAQQVGAQVVRVRQLAVALQGSSLARQEDAAVAATDDAERGRVPGRRWDKSTSKFKPRMLYERC